MSHDHEHGHHHHHDDDDDVQEHREHGAPLSEVELRVRALESLLVDKGLVEPAALDALIDTYETKVGPRNGAKIVARAWVDPAFKRRLLEDGTRGGGRARLRRPPVREAGGGREHADRPQHGRLHAVLLLSVGGAGPAAGLVQVGAVPLARRHRSRAACWVSWACACRPTTEVRVWDSTAEIRYMVLPERPAGTERMTEEQLAELVTRDAMIGVAKVPASAGASR